MRKTAAIMILMSLYICSKGQTRNSDSQIDNMETFTILAIDAKFPLRLDQIDLEYCKHTTLALNDGIVAGIEKTIEKYADSIEYSDSTQTYRDIYI